MLLIIIRPTTKIIAPISDPRAGLSRTPSPLRGPRNDLAHHRLPAGTRALPRRFLVPDKPREIEDFPVVGWLIQKRGRRTRANADDPPARTASGARTRPRDRANTRPRPG